MGGTPDPGHPAVVAIIHLAAQRQLCSGALVTPTVVITAAHCLADPNPLAYKVFFGADLNRYGGNLVDVSQVQAHPSFDINRFMDGYDIGVVVLSQPITVPPLPLGRSPLPPSFVGQQVTLVGFGVTGATAKDEGTKRVATTTISQLRPNQFVFGNSSYNTCTGDSGGPSFWSINGQETVVGVTSFGDQNCQVDGVATRVDAYLSFLDPYLLDGCGANGACVQGCAQPDPDCLALGAPCQDSNSCQSKLCLAPPAASGFICVATCDPADPASCPEGQGCATDTAGNHYCADPAGSAKSGASRSTSGCRGCSTFDEGLCDLAASLTVLVWLGARRRSQRPLR